MRRHPASSSRDRERRRRQARGRGARAHRGAVRARAARPDVGLIATITLVALESLAIGTVLPLVGDELGQLELYGWVYSAFFLGNLLGVVVAGGALDRLPLWKPFAVGLVLFGLGLLIGGLAPSMVILVGARFIQGLGGGAIGPTAYVAIGRTLPERLQPRMFALLSTAWVVPGVIGPSIAAIVGEYTTWRLVFLGLIPFLTVAGWPRGHRAAPHPGGRAAGGARRRRGDGPPAAQRPAGGRRRRAADRRRSPPRTCGS